MTVLVIVVGLILIALFTFVMLGDPPAKVVKRDLPKYHSTRQDENVYVKGVGWCKRKS